MSTVLVVLGWTLFGMALVVGLLLDLVGLFGNWIILAAIILAWVVTGFAHFSLPAIVVLAVLAVLGEVFEAVAAGVGARQFGGAKGTMVAALVGSIAGAIVGTPWFPLIGTLIGACLGAFAASVGYELLVMQRQMGAAVRTGFGAALGKIGGLFAKLFVGFAMLLVAALSF